MIGYNLHTRGPKRIHKLIAWFTRAKREGKTLSTHVAKIYSNDLILNPQAPRAVLWPLDQYLTEKIEQGYEWCVTGPKDILTSREEFECQKLMWEQIGWWYSFLEIPLEMTDGIIAKIRHKPKIGFDTIIFQHLKKIWKKGRLCSGYIARIDVKMCWKPHWLQYGNPDDCYDYEIERPEADWEIKQCSEGWLK